MREARRAVRGPSSEALHSDSAGDVFGTPEGLAAVRRAIIDAERVLRPDERAEVFRASALDTEENVQAARRRLAEPYPAEIGRSTAEQRVLALHLLSLSQHLAADDCFELLEHQLRAPEGSSSARTALLWDVLSLAKICGAKDGDRLRALRNGRAEGALDSQLDVALASLAEEHHK